MKHLKRLLYLSYYIKTTDWNKFYRFVKYVNLNYGISKMKLYSDVLMSSLKYNVSFLEYFLFHFWEKETVERKEWAGTGFMYEYQGRMNPRKYRDELEDKTKFYKTYGRYMLHKVSDIKDLISDVTIFEQFQKTPSGKIVFKIKNGGCGRKVLIKEVSEYENAGSLIEFMKNNKYDLVEEYIIQHKEMTRLAPSAVNTVRVITQLDNDDNPVILGCRLRIGINCIVDNLAAGNIAAPVDIETGIICDKGIYSDITKPDEKTHPVTKVPIVGFQIPFWKETIDLIKNAAVVNPLNRSVGWDIAITENGPDLIEGNREWCKLVYQLPVHKGMKNELEKYM